jgi:hypothetical protein
MASWCPLYEHFEDGQMPIYAILATTGQVGRTAPEQLLADGPVSEPSSTARLTARFGANAGRRSPSSERSTTRPVCKPPSMA